MFERVIDRGGGGTSRVQTGTVNVRDVYLACCQPWMAGVAAGCSRDCKHSTASSSSIPLSSPTPITP